MARVAIVTSLTGGLAHYCAHLCGPLSETNYLKFITYPQVDLSGTVVKEITDSFVKKYIKWPRFDLDENDPVSIVHIMEYLHARDVNMVNIHVATTVKRKINYFTTFIMFAKRKYRTKFVFTLHDVLPFDEDRKLIKLLGMFYSLADYFTVGNEGEKEKLMKYFKIPSHKISVIRHGVYNLFDRQIYNQQFARSYLGLPADKKIILFFGFLREYKGLEYLIRATKILSKKHDDFVVYMASGTKYADKNLVEKNIKLIGKFELQDKFIMNLNYLDTNDVEAVFKASDITALPYTHASQSGVMMMSFGFKKPVIITDVFYDREWVDHKAGLVAKAKDPQSIADKLDYILSNDTVRAEYGQYGYNYSMEHLNWNTIAKQYNEAYKRTLGK